jgi:hypothetical protein
VILCYNDKKHLWRKRYEKAFMRADELGARFGTCFL